MKKFISFLLVVLMIVFLTACQNKETKDTTDNSQVNVETTKPIEETAPDNIEEKTENTTPGILSIPSKDQQYYKRVVYKNFYDFTGYDIYNTAKFENDYLIISTEAVIENNALAEKNNFVVFNDNAELCLDGAEEKISYGTIIDKYFYHGEDKQLIDLETGIKKGWFENYIPLNYKNGYWTVKDIRKTSLNSGVIDDTGNEIIPCEYESIECFDDKGGAIVSVRDDQGLKYGMIDKSNNILIPIEYSYIIPFDKENSSKGSILYDDFGETYEYTVVVDDSDKTYTIDRNGNVIFDFSTSKYELASTHNGITGSQNLLPVTDNHKYGFIDMQGNEVIPLQYDKFSSDFVNGYACVSKDDKYGVINTKGEEIVPLNYYFLQPFDQKGLAVAKLDYNDTGKIVMDLAGNVAYSTTNDLEALGGGYFIETYLNGDSSMPSYKEIIQITTDSSEYTTYLPQDF